MVQRGFGLIPQFLHWNDSLVLETESRDTPDRKKKKKKVIEENLFSDGVGTHYQYHISFD